MWPKFLSNKKNYDYEVAALKLPTELEQECGAFHRARQSLSERLAAAVSITVQYFFIAAIIFFVYKATVGIHKSYQRANERTKSEDLNSENAKYAEMFEEFITRLA
uniref:Endoplasmic reticulum transmembrane protein n=1 Tax=Heterorhabditis bacteriophora TaxID=37862 RepID=A0A1I7X664_HETBA